jgi:hypothetical protein
LDHEDAINPTPVDAPADKASRAGLWLSIASFVSLGLSVWLAQFLGSIACNVGPFVWLILWTGGVGLAYSALRNSWGSRTPRTVERWAWGALGLSAVNLALALAFVAAVNNLTAQ